MSLVWIYIYIYFWLFAIVLHYISYYAKLYNRAAWKNSIIAEWFNPIYMFWEKTIKTNICTEDYCIYSDVVI